MVDWLPLSPGHFILLAGLLLPLIPTRLRDGYALIIPMLGLCGVWMTNPGDYASVRMLEHDFIYLYLHDFTRIFASAFCIAMLGGGLFAYGKARTTEVTAALIYGGSAVSVTYAGDLITFMIFWELMAIAATIIIWTSPYKGSRSAGLRYAGLHFLGGLFMLEGISFYEATHDSDAFTAITGAMAGGLSIERNLGEILIFLGVLVNLAAPPFSAWLADSYPKASPSGAVFLSAMTTKTAVFATLVLFPGYTPLIFIGLFMVFYGIIYAMLENDIRKILSYSIVNQVGFMVVAIGIGSPLALMGAACHAFCHIIYKALLLMSAGAVVEQTGKHRCTDLGGLYHSMPLTAICGIVGALAISAFPLTSGFISKSIISTAAADAHLTWVWLGLLAASAGVFLHAGIKFPWFVFFQRDSGLRPADPGKPMQAAMILFAALCLIPGLFPQMVYGMLPVLPDYEPNTLSHWATQLNLLLFSGLAFFLALPWLQRTLTISLDWDWLYRVPGLNMLRYAEWVWNNAIAGLWWLIQTLYQLGEQLIHDAHGPQGIFARTQVTGVILMWVGSMLGVYLLIYYFYG